MLAAVELRRTATPLRSRPGSMEGKAVFLPRSAMPKGPSSIAIVEEVQEHQVAAPGEAAEAPKQEHEVVPAPRQSGRRCGELPSA